MLSVHDKDKISMNGTSSTVGIQESESDKLSGELKISRVPEQGGATDTDLLVKERYLGPTNWNNEENEDSWLNNILHDHVEGINESPIPWPV